MKKCRKRKILKQACRTALPLIADYACSPGRLSPAQRRLVKRHLETCRNCSKTAEEIQYAVRILRSAAAMTSIPTRLTADRRQHILKLCEILHSPDSQRRMKTCRKKA